MDAVLVPFLLCIAAGVAIFARVVPQGRPRWWGWAAATVALVVASRLVGHSWPAIVLADLAELAAIGLVCSPGTPEARAAARKYAIAIVPAIVLTGFATAVIGAAAPGGALARFAVAAIVLGFALRLGLLPVVFLAAGGRARFLGDDHGPDHRRRGCRRLLRPAGPAGERALGVRELLPAVDRRRGVVAARRGGCWRWGRPN